MTLIIKAPGVLSAPVDRLPDTLSNLFFDFDFTGLTFANGQEVTTSISSAGGSARSANGGTARVASDGSWLGYLPPKYSRGVLPNGGGAIHYDRDQRVSTLTTDLWSVPGAVPMTYIVLFKPASFNGSSSRIFSGRGYHVFRTGSSGQTVIGTGTEVTTPIVLGLGWQVAVVVFKANGTGDLYINDDSAKNIPGTGVAPTTSLAIGSSNPSSAVTPPLAQGFDGHIARLQAFKRAFTEFEAKSMISEYRDAYNL